MIQITKRTVILFFVLLLALLAAACAPASTPEPTAIPASPTPLTLPTSAPATVAPQATDTTVPAAAATVATNDTELAGASLFQISCAECHGADVAGKTFEKDNGKITTPSLHWSDLSQTYATDPSRGSVADQVALSIIKGQDETGSDLNAMMPRWSSLSKSQVDSLVQYLQTTDSASGAAPTLTPAATNLMGEQLYTAACAACHGADGAGKTFDKDGNKIDTPSLHWSDLTKMYSMDPSRGTVEQQFAIAVTKGQDETGSDLNAMMPRWSSLSQAQVDSLAQYLQTTFK